MPQLLLTATSLSATASASAELTKALLLLEERLAAWSRDAIAFDALLQEVFGVETNTNSQRAALLTSISGSGLEIKLQSIDATNIDGLIAAYTSAAPDGGERIYLNASWLELATAELSSEENRLLKVLDKRQHKDGCLTKCDGKDEHELLPAKR